MWGALQSFKNTILKFNIFLGFNSIFFLLSTSEILLFEKYLFTYL